MSSPASALRALVNSRELTVVAECISAATARVVEELGFQATYCGGNALGTFHHAIPDYGLLAPAELAAHVSNIAAAVSIPILVDADQGGETVASVRRTVAVFEVAGASGLHIEDSTNPKHSRLVKGLMPIDEMKLRIAAAVEARRDPDFVVIARCEGLFNKLIYGVPCSVDEVIERGIEYAAAGADAFMPICMSPADIATVARAVGIPIVDINQSVAAIGEAPLSMVVHSGWAGASMVGAFTAIAATLRDSGEVSRETFRYPNRPTLIRQAAYDELLAGWAAHKDEVTLAEGRSLTTS